MGIMATDGGFHTTTVTENTESCRSLRSVSKDPFGWTSLRVLVQRICETYTLQLVSQILLNTYKWKLILPLYIYVILGK